MKRNIYNTHPMTPTTVWNRNFLLLFISNCCMYLSIMMLNTLVPQYASTLGVTSTIVGMISGAFAYTCLAFKLISGPAIDTFNKKYILTGAMCVLVLAFVGYGVAENAVGLFVSRLLQGAAQAFTASCCLTLAAEFIPPDKTASGIGYFSLAQTTCQAMGPAIGLWLSKSFGYSFAFFSGAILTLVGASIVLLLKNNYQKHSHLKISLNAILAKEALIPATLSMLVFMVMFNINSFLLIYAGLQGIDNVGMFFTIHAVTLIVTRPFIGRLADKYGLLKTLAPSLMFFALGLITVSVADRVIILLLAAVLTALGSGVSLPTLQAMCMKIVPPERRGAASCTSMIGQDLGSLLGPVLAGAIVDYCGNNIQAYAIMWRLELFPLAVALILAFSLRRRIIMLDNI